MLMVTFMCGAPKGGPMSERFVGLRVFPARMEHEVRRVRRVTPDCLESLEGTERTALLVRRVREVRREPMVLTGLVSIRWLLPMVVVLPTSLSRTERPTVWCFLLGHKARKVRGVRRVLRVSAEFLEYRERLASRVSEACPERTGCPEPMGGTALMVPLARKVRLVLVEPKVLLEKRVIEVNPARVLMIRLLPAGSSGPSLSGWSRSRVSRVREVRRVRKVRRVSAESRVLPEPRATRVSAGCRVSRVLRVPRGREG